ncbi:hypothetical protein C5B42_04955, partial [Candidatus Cerribacteria bacterium 'Amazon FNV 2010 28 9']
IPATLGNDVPHANRGLMGLPWMQLLAGVGFLSIIQWATQSRKISLPVVFGACIVVAAIGLIWHVDNDAQVYASSAALKDFQYGYKEAVEYARSQESAVSKIYFSDVYSQAYVFILFYKKINPIDYRGGALANYDITQHAFADARGQKNVLIIAPPSEVPSDMKIEKTILFPDGTVAFDIIRQ